jgi:hypothetical protein
VKETAALFARLFVEASLHLNTLDPVLGEEELIKFTASQNISPQTTGSKVDILYHFRLDGPAPRAGI